MVIELNCCNELVKFFSSLPGKFFGLCYTFGRASICLHSAFVAVKNGIGKLCTLSFEMFFIIL